MNGLEKMRERDHRTVGSTATPLLDTQKAECQSGRNDEGDGWIGDIRAKTTRDKKKTLRGIKEQEKREKREEKQG